MSRAFDCPGALTSWDNVGLDTEFGAIPEASAWAMLLLGSAGLRLSGNKVLQTKYRKYCWVNHAPSSCDGAYQEVSETIIL